MKQLTLFFLAFFCFSLISLRAQPDTDVFSLLNLSHKGLEQVKSAYEAGDRDKALTELLWYYQTRTRIELPDLDLSKVSNSEAEQHWVDESLENRFYAHRAYDIYFYGDDINWRLWPIKHNELRWQLHRHYWFIALAKAYYVTKDRKYLDAWIYQYTDWVKKNPLVIMDKGTMHEIWGKNADASQLEADAENSRFAWRPLETSHRLQAQLSMFTLTIDSPYFTKEFLDMFLVMYHQHATHILNNYSTQGNHLLFEAQRMIFGGIYFPEFKDAYRWRESGIEILNREINVQVYDDGMQYELDPGYHTGAINTFLKALEMAKINGMSGEFPSTYSATIENMIEVTWNMMYPDYSTPLFSDAKRSSKNSGIRSFSGWSKIFPENQQIAWFVSDRTAGSVPAYTSKAFKTSGFFMFRNGWQDSATTMILKAGPPAFWHNQPDNGTFELWRKGRNFFYDSGCYVYGGDEEVQKQRDWFRQTRVHNTLTLDNRTLDKTDSKLRYWNDQGSVVTLVTENEGYENLKHRRSVFFVEGDFFVIVDEAKGTAVGDVAVHFNLSPCEVALDAGKLEAKTLFPDQNNIIVRTFVNAPARMTNEEGWVSFEVMQKEERPAYAVRTEKKAGDEPVFITVIFPTEIREPGEIKASYQNTSADGKNFTVTVGGKTYQLSYSL